MVCVSFLITVLFLIYLYLKIYWVAGYLHLCMLFVLDKPELRSEFISKFKPYVNCLIELKIPLCMLVSRRPVDFVLVCFQ